MARDTIEDGAGDERTFLEAIFRGDLEDEIRTLYLAREERRKRIAANVAAGNAGMGPWPPPRAAAHPELRLLMGQGYAGPSRRN